MKTKAKPQITLEEFEKVCKSRGYVPKNLCEDNLTYSKFNGTAYIEVCEYTEEGYVEIFTDLKIVRDKNGKGLFIVSTINDNHPVFLVERLNELLDEYDKKYKELQIQMQKENIEEMFK